MKGRITDAGGKRLARLNHATEHRQRRTLTPQLQAHGQRRIRAHEPLRMLQGDRIRLRADKTPIVIATTEDRVNAVRADADIQNRGGRSAWKFTLIAAAQQIRHMVQIIGASRNRRTQITRRNVPRLKAVIHAQQRLIQRLHRRRIREIDRGVAVGIDGDKRRQSRRTRREPRKIIARPVTVARMQTRFDIK